MNDQDDTLLDLYHQYCQAEGTKPSYGDFMVWLEEQGLELTKRIHPWQVK